MPEYPKEQIWKIYEKLPEELKEAIFSEGTAESIGNVCEKNGIDDPEKVSEIARLTGDVLLGLLPPDEFQETLEKELNLKPDVAKKVNAEIHRFVFYPIRESLSVLYQTQIVPPGMPKRPAKKAPPEKKEPKKKDVYREPIE